MSAADVLDMARQRGIMIATAESCTGGLLSAALTEVPGSSDVFDRGFVTYSNEAKTELLGVGHALITAYGAVSPEVACAMAEGALKHSKAQLAVSITGVAGPGGTAQKPEGMVCFGLAQSRTDGVRPSSTVVQFGALGRAEVRKASVDHAVQMLVDAIHKTPID